MTHLTDAEVDEIMAVNYGVPEPKRYTTNFTVDSTAYIYINADGTLNRIEALADGDINDPFDGYVFSDETGEPIDSDDDALYDTLREALDGANWGNPSLIDP